MLFLKNAYHYLWGKIDCAALCPSRVWTSDWASCLCIRKHLVTLLNPLICPVHQSNREPSVAGVREQHNADDIRMMSCQGGDRQTCRQQQLKVKRIQPIAHWRERASGSSELPCQLSCLMIAAHKPTYQDRSALCHVRAALLMTHT